MGGITEFHKPGKDESVNFFSLFMYYVITLKELKRR